MLEIILTGNPLPLLPGPSDRMVAAMATEEPESFTAQKKKAQLAKRPSQPRTWKEDDL